MIPIAIEVSTREVPRTWAVYLRSELFGWPTFQRSVPLTALDSLDEQYQRARAGFEVIRCRPWLRFENTWMVRYAKQLTRGELQEQAA